ncbi:uncharacterized protein V1518DRAFT_414482 [Limtongia smithiae]|uniref:uncharacterized protein n=1 Tax=Limtongia smithiae TaxID=1125753 RepID=UPI0034CD5565
MNALEPALRAKCDTILADPEVLEEEQTDQISYLIQQYYASRGLVLTSADLDSLVLDVLWQHRAGGTGGPATQFSPSSGGGPGSTFGGFGGSSGAIPVRKVVKNRFVVPIATPPAGRSQHHLPLHQPSYAGRWGGGGGVSATAITAQDLGSLPSTRSASPDSLYSTPNRTVPTSAFTASTQDCSRFLDVFPNKADSQTVQTKSNTVNAAGIVGLSDDMQQYNPFFLGAEEDVVGDFDDAGNHQHDEYDPHDDDFDDEEDMYRPLTVEQRLGLDNKVPSGAATSARNGTGLRYTDGMQFEPSSFEMLSAWQAYHQGGGTQSTGMVEAQAHHTHSTASSESSPSTPASSFTAFASAAGGSGSSGTTVPMGADAFASMSSTPTANGAATPSQLSPSVSAEAQASPFDHIRVAMCVPEAANVTNAEITLCLEKNGYDVLLTLKELVDRVTGRTPAAKVADSVKVQTIGPVYSIQTQHTSTSATKEHPKIPTVCRYFLTTGQCLRPDCRYSHDLSATVCRYWLQNSCLAGDTCVFLHSIPPEITARVDPRGRGIASILPGGGGGLGLQGGSVGSLNGLGTAMLLQQQQPQKKNITLKDEMEFPSLPGSDSSVPKSSPAMSTKSSRAGSALSSSPRNIKTGEPPAVAAVTRSAPKSASGNATAGTGGAGGASSGGGGRLGKSRASKGSRWRT